MEGEAKARRELWISQLEESKRRGIDYLEVFFQTTGLNKDALPWTADGKLVSFLDWEVPYTAPDDEGRRGTGDAKTIGFPYEGESVR